MKFVTWLLLFASAIGAVEVKLEQVLAIQGIRENQLVGYGLVTGLAGKGDSRGSVSSATIQSLLKKYGQDAPAKGKYRNTAAVMVMATLPPFSSEGDKIDIQVSALGDAKSLSGGSLLQTALYGADGNIYAVAQGVIQAAERTKPKRSRYSFTGYELFSGSDFRRGNLRSALIPGGAIIEKEVPQNYLLRDTQNKTFFELKLRSFQMSAAFTILRKINEAKLPGVQSAFLASSGRIRVYLDDEKKWMEVVSAIMNLSVDVNPIAKVIVDSRSGLILISGDVPLNQTAVIEAGGSGDFFSELEALNEDAPSGNSRLVPQTVSLKDLVRAFNKAGFSSAQILRILKALHAAGALNADLVII